MSTGNHVREAPRLTFGEDERGASLVFVLLVTVLLTTLLAGFLSIATSESRHGAHARDSVRAFEIAEAGVDETLARLGSQHPYRFFCAQGQSFQISLSSRATDRVCIETTEVTGPGIARYVVRSQATVAAATHRIMTTVRLAMTLFPNGILLAEKLTLTGNAHLLGDTYSRTSVETTGNGSWDGPVYAGYWMKGTGTPFPQGTWYSAYSDPACNINPNPQPPACTLLVEGTGIFSQRRVRWWPGTRLSVFRNGVRGQEINSAPTGTTYDGLKYRIYTDQLQDAGGITQNVQRLYVIYEDWLALYYACGDTGCTKLNIPGAANDLLDDPRRGAIPPIPSIDDYMGQCDICYPTGGDINGNTTIGSSADPKIIVFGTSGGSPVTAKVNGNSTIYGVVVTKGDLTFTGNTNVYGMIITSGSVGTGNSRVYGGVITAAPLVLTGNTYIDPGTAVTFPPIGFANGLVVAWWER